MTSAVQTKEAVAARSETVRPLFQAEGIVRGTLVPERNLLIGYDNQVYPVTIAPALRRWFMKNPEEVSRRYKARHDYYRVFPRSLKGDKLGFYVADMPSCSVEELDIAPYKFIISGTVLNQRSLSTQRSPDHVVVRVKPNKVVSPAERHLPENRAHLHFLRGRVVPAAAYIGKHATFFCELSRGELWIRGCAPALENTVERVLVGNVMLPWPFRDLNSSTWKLVHDWNQLQPPFPDAPDAREQLLENLKAWRQSAQELQAATVDGTVANRDQHRSVQIASVLFDRVKQADANKLRSFVHQRGLLALSKLIRSSLSSKPALEPQPLTPDKTMTSAVATRPAAGADSLLDLLAQPMMDEMIIWKTKLTRPQLVHAVQHLWASGQITPEIEARSRSYQLKKYKPGG